MQTVEPYVEPTSDQPPRGPGPVSLFVVGVLVVGASALAIQSRLGVAVAIGVAFVVAVGLFVLRRGFALIEIVAFLIHFDGLGVSEISLGRILSAIAILVIVYKLVVEKWRPPAIPMRAWLPVLALVTWGLVSAAWSPKIGSWFQGLGTLGLAVAYFAVAAFLVDSYEKVEQFLRAYWYGGVFGAVMGVWGLILGVRVYGFNGDANLFGILAASMIPLTFYYLRKATTRNEKIIYGCVLLLVLGGAAGAGSRSGVIGAAVALFGSLVYRPGVSVGRRVATVVPAGVATALVAVVLLVLNPNTLVRGTDSSGRLDFWNVTVDLIEESPIIGQGLHQVPSLIPGRLSTTPGAHTLSDPRTEVSSHNTWLEMAGDLGFVGVFLFISIVVVAILGLLRPRWRQTKELSTYVFLMFLPVLSGSMFLPVSNNKLAWSVIGLAAALQVPSWGNRYRGYFARAPSDDPGEEFNESRLARWDSKISQRFRRWVVLGGVGGAVILGMGSSLGTVEHSAHMQIVAPKLDLPPGFPHVVVDRDRIQNLHTLVRSDAYAAELKKLSGVDKTPQELAEGVQVVLPVFGPYMDIVYNSADAEEVELIGPQLLTALDTVIEDGRVATSPVLADEVRPENPGEQRYYTGPLYLAISQQPNYATTVPRRSWLVFVGGMSGAAIALGFSLLQQRRPRVNNDDDFRHAVGMPLWTHVGRNGRRNAATADQYAQVAVTTLEVSERDRWPRHILLATPEHNRSARVLASGIAASLAASGERVVLVDGQIERPWLSWRLGAGRRRGMSDLSLGRAELSAVISRPRRWGFPRAVRRILKVHGENLRLIPAGRRRRGEEPTIDPAVLSGLDEDIITVMLAPPLLGTHAVSPSLRWADVVLYNLVEGETVTFDAEDAALQISTFADGPAGVVLSDV